MKNRSDPEDDGGVSARQTHRGSRTHQDNHEHRFSNIRSADSTKRIPAWIEITSIIQYTSPVKGSWDDEVDLENDASVAIGRSVDRVLDDPTCMHVSPTKSPFHV